MSAFSTWASPHSGQVISPALCCASKPSPSRNQASNSWPAAQRNVNRIIEPTSRPAYLYPNIGLSNRETGVLTNHEHPPSGWVRRFLPLIRRGGKALDLAAGGGRHTRLFLDMGLQVTAVDRNVEALLPLAGPHCTISQVDLENGTAWPLGGGYDAIVVTNYLHRPLFPAIREALAVQGVLIYETF